jgi:hypothetical protein
MQSNKIYESIIDLRMHANTELLFLYEQIYIVLLNMKLFGKVMF